MRICLWCNFRHARGAHEICRECWKWFIFKRQDKSCARCGNDSPTLADYEWSEYDVNAPRDKHSEPLGELVCKPCHRKLARRKLIQVNLVVNDSAMRRGRSYWEKLVVCGVDAKRATEICTELDGETEKYILNKRKMQQLFKERWDGRTDGFRRRAIARILVREHLHDVATQLRLKVPTREVSRKSARVGECTFCKTVCELPTQKGGDWFCAECSELLM